MVFAHFGGAHWSALCLFWTYQLKSCFFPIVINGIHTEKLEDKAFKDLVGLVCKLYSGKKPDECQQDLVQLSLIV